jgi:hypothetical protein
MPDEDLIFGDDVSIDLMLLDGNAVLHVVDTATNSRLQPFSMHMVQNMDNLFKECG